MFSNLLGKLSSDETNEDLILEEKIAKMDLSEMRLYVNDKLTDFKVTEFGLHEIIKKLISKNENTSQFYIADNDMDSKRKKAFELLILILAHKNISVLSLESAEKFLEVYEEMIKKYDYDNKNIYNKKIKDMMSLAINKINMKSHINEVISLSK